MSALQTTWINGEPVAVPSLARVVHVEGERLAMVAVPTWRVVLLTPSGSVEAPEGTTEGLLREYFPDLAKEDSEEDSGVAIT